MAGKGKTLSDKISALINPKPNITEVDDEDLTTIEQLHVDAEDNEVCTDELELGHFRKLNIELLDNEDNKYVGKKTTRKGLDDEDAFGNDSSDVSASSDEEKPIDENSDEKQSSEDESEIDSDKEDSEYDSDVEEEEEEDSEDDEEEEDEDSVEEDEDDNTKEKDDIEKFSRNIESDIEKGNAIRNQINIWDFLLECRIKFQKCLTASNQLPQGEKYSEFKEEGGEEYQNTINGCESSLKNLLSSLLSLQKSLKQELPLKTSPKKHHLEQESDSSDPDSPPKSKKPKLLDMGDISETLSEDHEKFKPFRDETIQKWNDKTKISQISNKNFSAFEQSTLKQIEQILMDKSRLIRRTQLKRSNYQILGKDEGESSPAKQAKMEENDYNTEIYDDNDFYHQLLRELLERKSTDITDPTQISKQWIQLQKLRSKMKRNIDTRATKGRKIKYVVHQKLVNFMMPVVNHSWTEDSKNELFSSLFGKNKN